MISMDTFVTRRPASRRVGQGLGSFAALVFVAACSSSSGTSGAGGDPTQPAAVTCASPGMAAPVTASTPADTHCTVNGMAVVQATDLASCNSDAAAAGDDTGDDGGAPVVEDGGGPTGDCEPSEYGPSEYGQSGSDDDCKYDVSWTSTPICEGGNGVYFTLNVKSRVDSSAVTGANPYIEAVKGCVTPAQNPAAPGVTKTTELGGGQYKIGPIVFPVGGTWVIRFHIFGLACSDVLPTSPHGHAAFFVDVP